MATFEAKILPSWVRGKILRGLLFIAFASLFVYDGAFAWPKRNATVQEYLKFVEKEGKSKYDWPAHAEKLGLRDYTLGQVFMAKSRPKESYDHESEKNQRQLNEQFIWAIGLSLVGIGFWVWILLNRGKVLAYDETALIGPDGKRVPLASIKEIATEKWEKKGLAYVRYEEEPGVLKKLTLDDLKFDGAEKVLEHAQAHLGLPLESEVRKKAQAERAAREQAEAEAEAGPSSSS
jgi:hypothetical protein